MKTTMAVSSKVNEVLMELVLQNREYAPLELNVEPHQYIDFLKCDQRGGVYASHDHWNVTVSTDTEGASGTWLISMIWDQCFSEEALAIQSMMDAYITYTGDRSIWDEVIEGKMV